MSVEVLAQLSARAVRFDAVRGRCYGALTGTEVAGLLAGLHEIAVDFALAKYLLDEAAEAKVLAWVIALAEQLRRDLGWKMAADKPYLDNLVRVVVAEHVKPLVCPACFGLGYQGVKLCSSCHGLSIKRLSNRSVAKSIGVCEKQYREVWRERHCLLSGKLQHIDNLIVANLIKKSYLPAILNLGFL